MVHTTQSIDGNCRNVSAFKLLTAIQIVLTANFGSGRLTKYRPQFSLLYFTASRHKNTYTHVFFGRSLIVDCYSTRCANRGRSVGDCSGVVVGRDVDIVTKSQSIAIGCCRETEKTLIFCFWMSIMWRLNEHTIQGRLPCFVFLFYFVSYRLNTIHNIHNRFRTLKMIAIDCFHIPSGKYQERLNSKKLHAQLGELGKSAGRSSFCW